MLVYAAERTDRSVHENQPSTSSWVRENFIVGDVIGHGTFGKVYTVECRKRKGQIFAMKELMRFSHPKYIEMELRILQEFGGVCNVMQMHAAYRDRDRVFVIMDYFPHDSLKEIIDTLTIDEILGYMKNLFIALQYLHKNGIIHRDVKPANFLFNRKMKKYALIDFGLSQKYEQPVVSKENISPNVRRSRAVKRICLSSDGESPGEKRVRGKCECFGRPFVCPHCQTKPHKSVNKAGTPGFRAPETLLRVEFQTPLIDVWAAGVTMLSLLCRMHPIMRPSDDQDAIVQIGVLMGTAPLIELANEDGQSLTLKPSHAGVDLGKLALAARGAMDTRTACAVCSKLIFGCRAICICKSDNEEPPAGIGNAEILALEVLKRCLIVNPKYRYTSQMVLSLID